MSDPFEAIRAHVEKHAGKERATFSIAGIKALLDAVQEAAAPSEEPVAQWQIWVEDGVGPDGWVNEDAEMIEHWRSKGRKVRALFASPAVAPVAVSVELAAKLESQAKILDGMAFKMRLPPGDNNLEDASAFMREAARILSSIIPEDAIRRAAIEDVLGLLTGHELYRYRPKAFNGFIEYARTELAALAQDTDATPHVAPTGTVGTDNNALLRAELAERLLNLAKVGFGYDIKPDDRDNLRIAAAVLSAPTVEGEAPADGWQPIETAPKDGTYVILAVPHYESGWNIGEAYFDPQRPDGGDWWWAGSSDGDYWSSPLSDSNHNPPSHWQPLPAPPATSTQGERL